jgi:hemoglobin-like flavoprotein
MTPAQIHLLRDSFALLLPRADATAARFYEHLFAAAPALRKLFPTDLTVQRGKLMQMLGGAVGLADKPHLLMPMLRQLGARHATSGVRAGHYPVVGIALLTTLAETLGERFDEPTRTAWESLYALVAGLMIEGAEATATTAS